MRIKDGHWLITTPIAHRGLHNDEFCENSIESFILAAQKGYAIEIDVRFTKDLKVIVFHDDTLDRVTNGKGKVNNYTYKELLEFDLKGGKKIPLFKDALNAINGKVPFLIEVKDQGKVKNLVLKTLKILENYKGEYALQSFNPFYVRDFKRLAPNIMRGQLATKYPDGQGKFTSFLLRRFYFNFLTKPDFISFDIKHLPYAPAKRKNTRLIAWTVDSQQKLDTARKHAENIIFENINPK